MLHVLASIGFSLLTITMLSYLGLTLLASSEAILAALGIGRVAIERRPHHPVRVRSAGRWQSVQTMPTQPKRAAA